VKKTIAAFLTCFALLIGCQLEWATPKIAPAPMSEIFGTYKSNTMSNSTQSTLPRAKLTILPDGKYIHEFEFEGKTSVDTNRWQLNKPVNGLIDIHVDSMRCFTVYHLDTTESMGTTMLFGKYRGKTLLVLDWFSDHGSYYFEKQEQQP
jgi:hypothetical protein